MKSKNPKIQKLNKGLVILMLLTVMFSTSLLTVISYATEILNNSITLGNTINTENNAIIYDDQTTSGGTTDENQDDDTNEKEWSDVIEDDEESEYESVIIDSENLKNQLEKYGLINYEEFFKEINEAGNSKVIEISNEAQLRALVLYVAEGGKTLNKTFRLTKNIVLSSDEWTPIGNSQNPFKGTFDGAGYTISNIAISKKQSFAGLFGYISNATIKNLNIGKSNINMNLDITSKYLNDIRKEKTVNYSYLGAIVGYARDSEINNCKNIADILGGQQVGGIVGGSTRTSIFDCSNSGTIEALRSVGGICGSFYGTHYNESEYVENGQHKISRCENTGTVIGILENAAGICGSLLKYSVIEYCSNSGDISIAEDKVVYYTANGNEITHENPQNIGGIVGWASGEGDAEDSKNAVYIKQCINYEEAITKGYQDVGGIAGQLGGLNGGQAYVENCISYSNNIKVSGRIYTAGKIAGCVGCRQNNNGNYENTSIGYIKNCYYILSDNDSKNIEFTEDSTYASYLKSKADCEIRGYGIASRAEDGKMYNYVRQQDKDSSVYKIKKENGKFSYIAFKGDKVENGAMIVNLSNENITIEENFSKLKNLLESYGCKIEKNGTYTVTDKNEKIDNNGKIFIDKTSPKVVTDKVTVAETENTYSKVTLYLNGKEVSKRSLAKKGDLVTIKIEFDENINISSTKPQLKIAGNKNATYTRLDGKNIFYTYTVTGKENGATIGTSMKLSGNIKDIFENKCDLENTITVNSDNDIIILKNNANQIELTTSDGLVGYIVSGFTRGIDGNYYYNTNTENNMIKVVAKFSGNAPNTISNPPKLYINSKGFEYESDNDNEESPYMITYNIDASKLVENNENVIRIEKIYLSTGNNKITINPSVNLQMLGENKNENTTLATKVEISNLYVDMIAPYIAEIKAKAIYPNSNKKYTSKDEIEISLTTNELLNLEGSGQLPNVNVLFGDNEGKFNKGKAEFIEAIKNENNTYTCKYRYVIQSEDNGILKVSYGGNLKDIAGNENKLDGTKEFANITADTTSPTVAITAQKVEGENKTDITNSITNADILEYTFAWSEEVKDFVVEDITINGGKVKDGTTLTQNSTDKTKYTLQVEPNVSNGNIGKIEVIVEAGVCKDDVSLENIRTENKITIDKKVPNLTDYETTINDDGTQINIKAIFDEAIGTVSTSDIEIKFKGNDANGSVSTATIDVNDNRIVNYVYNISGADEGIPTIKLKSNTVEDIAENKNSIDVIFENNIKLEKHVLKVNNNEYSFAYKKDGENGYTSITDFSQPTYLKAGEKIKVTKITEQGNTSYEYEVEDGKYLDNTHMTYMKLIEAQEDEDIGEIRFSNDEENATIEISDANIYFDTKAPTVTLISSVEEPLENNVYAKGTKIIITANISENILYTEDKPEVKVSFSKSGTGKYNYHGNSGSNAKFISSFEVVDEEDELEYIAGWDYVYVVTEGDEGEIILDYASDLTISDLAGNKTSLTGYPNAPETSIKTDDLTNKEISGKETKVTYEFYKGNSKITDFTQNTYYKTGDKIRVDAEFSNELYSSWGSTTTVISKDTAPKLIINNKEFTAENVINNKKISYTYTVSNDGNMQLTNLQLKSDEELYARKSDNTYEELSGNITENLDISNANLYIYNNSTEFENSNIKADTTVPTVTITAKNADSDILNNTTNANKLIYTFTWSEKVVGFTADDITVNNGTKGTLSTVTENENGTCSYTMEITPNVENGNEGDTQVIVEQNACQDLVGQSNVRTESIIRIDKKAPILISLEAYAESEIKINSNVDTIKQYYKEGDTVTVIATFSENISEEEKTKLVLEFSESGNANGSVSNATVDGNKLKYTYTITNGDNGNLSVKGFTGKVTDGAGNVTQVTKRTLEGDTIIADTIAPKLKELKLVEKNSDAIKAENIVKIEAIFDEEIYVLDSNKIKHIDANIEIESEDGTKTYTNNAPILKIKFGEGDTKQMTALGYGQKEDGSIDKTKIVYSYTIVDEQEKVETVNEEEIKTKISGDNGKLSIVSYANQENVKVCDIAGNEANLGYEFKDEILVDTIRPRVENITAVVENPTIGNTGIYHKAGNKIKITVTFSEKVNPAVLQPKIQVGFSENESEEPTTYKDKAYESDWNAYSETVEYTYDIEDGDNGYLWVKVPENQFEDEAGNKNIAKEGTKLSNIYADTTIPTVTLYRDTEETQNNQIITVKAKFNENVYDLDDNTKISLTNSNAPKLVYSFGTGNNQEVGASSVSNEIITYTIRKDSVKDNGDLHYELAKGNLCDRAGNEFYKSSLDTTAPELKDVYISSNSTYGEYCKEGVNVKVIAQFNEDISNQKMEIKFKIGQGSEQTISGNIDNEDKTKIVFNYQVKAGDNGEFTILDVQGNTVNDEKLTDKTYGYVRDEHGNQKNIFNFDGVTIRGKAIADTIKPYITKVEAKVDNKVIASYTKEEGKDVITTVGKTNANEIEYVITFSELVNYKGGMQIYNGAIKDIKNNDTNEDGYYNQVTVKVQPTIEGVQSLIISDGVFEDRAGNGNNSERFNLITTDFTKPTIRFISEYNGGTYVIPTNIGKVEIRPNVEISEDITKVEYKWDNEDYTEINNYSTSSDIAIPTRAFKEAGTYKLSVKVQDLAGNISESSKTYKVINSNINITLDKTEWTNQDITVTVEFGEGLTDNRKVTFKSEITDEMAQLNAIGTDENGNTQYTITENGILYAEATDKVGNKVFTEKTVTNIDKEKPVIKIDLNEADLVIGTGKNEATIKTNVTVEDNKVLDLAKFAYIQKDIDIANISAEDKTLIATNLSNEAKIENAMSTKDKTPYYLYVIAKDKAGNETIAKAGPFTVLDSNEREKVIEATETTPETKETIPAEIEISKLIAFKKDGKRFNISYNNFEDGDKYINIIKEKEITLSKDEDGFIDYENYSYVDVNKPTTIKVIGKDVCGNEVIATKEVTREMIEGPEFEVYGNPDSWTNEDVKLEVNCSEELSALTVNGKDILANMSEVISENGDYKFIATDKYGMTSEKTIEVTKIDKNNPVISKTETSGKTITITAEDAISGVAKYAITDTTEVPSEWNDSKEIKITHDGIFYAWVVDNAGNITRSEDVVTVDTTAPTITKVESKDKTITIVAKDTTSGVAKYAITNTTEEPTQWNESNVITVEEDGKFYAWAMDGVGNVTKAKDIVVVDTMAPTITKVESKDKTITITAEDTTSGVAKYAITDTTEVPVEWTDSKEIKVTHDGKFYAWAMDNAGNVIRAEEVVTVDTTAPTITFKYSTTTAKLGNSIGATIITNEDAQISYSWDNNNWTTSEDYLLKVNSSNEPTEEGTYTLYAKATDKYGNTSDVETLEFTIIKEIENIEVPEIIFEDLPTMKVDEAYYVKVAADMTMESITEKMDKKALCNVTPEYTKLTDENKLKTGSEIKLNGDTKYIVIVNGDVNCDGKVGPIDVTYANSIRLNKVNANTVQKLAADFDLDGLVKPIDITMINSYRLGKIKGI